MTDVCLAGVVGGVTIEPAPCYLDSNRVHRSGVAPGNTVCLWLQVVRLHWAKAQGPLE